MRNPQGNRHHLEGNEVHLDGAGERRRKRDHRLRRGVPREPGRLDAGLFRFDWLKYSADKIEYQCY